jgi:hypothetical protein
MLYVHVQELLPGPSEHCAYKFKVHGYVQFADAGAVRAWWRRAGASLAPWPAIGQHFDATGWSGWAPNNFGLSVHSARPGNAGAVGMDEEVLPLFVQRVGVVN